MNEGHQQGCEVHGPFRRTSTFKTGWIEHPDVDPHDDGVRLFQHYADLAEGARLVTLLTNIATGEVFHMASQRQVRLNLKSRSALASPGYGNPLTVWRPSA